MENSYFQISPYLIIAQSTVGKYWKAQIAFWQLTIQNLSKTIDILRINLLRTE